MARFESTIWTVIMRAKEGRETAIEDFVSKYRPALLSFIMKSGFPEDEAEDLVQEVFFVVFKDEILKKADAAKGRFRNFITQVTKNIIARYKERKSAKKRGGGSLLVPLETVNEAKLRLASSENDHEFDRIWVLNLVEIAFNRLKKDCEDKEFSYFRPFELYLKGELSYKDIAKKLGRSINDVKFSIHKSRLKLREYIKEEIMSYSSSLQEYEDEIRYLSRYLEDS